MGGLCGFVTHVQRMDWSSRSAEKTCKYYSTSAEQQCCYSKWAYVIIIVHTGWTLATDRKSISGFLWLERGAAVGCWLTGKSPIACLNVVWTTIAKHGEKEHQWDRGELFEWCAWWTTQLGTWGKKMGWISNSREHTGGGLKKFITIQ